jgi:hypothetical protein
MLARELPELINILNSKSKVKFINIYSLEYYYNQSKPSKITVEHIKFNSPNKYICYHTSRETRLVYKNIKTLIERYI